MQASLRTGPRGHIADLLTFPPTRTTTLTKPSVVVLFVPGNPGLPQFYTPFLTALQSALPPGSTACYALGHLGHSPSAQRIWSGAEVASLKEQVEHKIAFVDELEKEYGLGTESGPKLVLIGHSIGSWIICEILKLRPHLISSAHLLFPTISHMLTSPNGKRMTPLFSPRLSAPFALGTSLLSLTPSALLRPIVGVLSQQRGQAAAVTTSLVQSPGTVVAAFTLAAEEMSAVKELDKACLTQFGDRMRWYWAKEGDDEWVSESSVREIEGVLDDAGYAKEKRVRCEEGMVHAFVLNDDHVDSLARRCAGWIGEDCDLRDE